MTPENQTQEDLFLSTVTQYLRDEHIHQVTGIPIACLSQYDVTPFGVDSSCRILAVSKIQDDFCRLLMVWRSTRGTIQYDIHLLTYDPTVLTPGEGEWLSNRTFDEINHVVRLHTQYGRKLPSLQKDKRVP